MAAIFTDINIALRHLVSHNGLDSVLREGKNCEFKNYNDYHLLVALLTEVGLSEEARLFFETFSLKKGKQDYVVRNYLYATGTFRSINGIMVGDLFWAKQSNATASEVTGVVLEKDEEGRISRYITLEQRGYDRFLIINQDVIDPLNILESFSLKLPIEPLAKDSTAISFYGNFYEEILQKRGQVIYGYNKTVGSSNYEVLIFNMDGFFKYMSFGAPTWIIQRFLMLGHIRQAKHICAGLGKGVQVFNPENKMNPGTILFTNETAISMLLGGSGDGRALSALVPRVSRGGYDTSWIQESTITHFWEPSIEPFEFVVANQNPAFKDINRMIGAAYCLYGTYYNLAAYNYAIFDFNLIRDPECWHPEVYKMLCNAKSRQDPSYWMSYLADKGAGLMDGTNTPQAGDFLFVEVEKQVCAGIAIDSENMVYSTYWTQEFDKGKIEKLKKIWRPSL